MGGVIGQSRKLITKYARREFTDKVGIPIVFFLSLLDRIVVDFNSICPRILLRRSPLYFEKEALS